MGSSANDAGGLGVFRGHLLEQGSRSLIARWLLLTAQDWPKERSPGAVWFLAVEHGEAWVRCTYHAPGVNSPTP